MQRSNDPRTPKKYCAVILAVILLIKGICFLSDYDRITMLSAISEQEYIIVPDSGKTNPILEPQRGRACNKLVWHSILPVASFLMGMQVPLIYTIFRDFETQRRRLEYSQVDIQPLRQAKTIQPDKTFRDICETSAAFGIADTCTCEKIMYAGERGRCAEIPPSLTENRNNRGNAEKYPFLQGKSVLIVDSDPDFCRSISAILDDIGIICDWCVSGKEAVEQAGEAVFCGEPYDIYLISCDSNDIEWKNTAAGIRSEAGKKARIVAMSASYPAYSGDNPCVTGFIRKPEFLSDIMDLLRDHSVDSPASGSFGSNYPELVGKRILLAEDSEANRCIVSEVLADVGLPVDIAENGKVACDILFGSAPGYYDLVLMDMHMPVMDGFEAARTIRAFSSKEISGIPIIALTAHTGEETIRAVFDAGMDSYVFKPFDTTELIGKIATIIRMRAEV